MRAKSERRQQAEALRREQGLSYREIEAAIGVGRGTLSGWLKDIQLTPDQEVHLQRRLRANRGSFAARALPINRARHQQARDAAYAAGAAVAARLAGTDDVDELALAMLYLGEGSKTHGRVQMANTRADILRYFLRALRRLYQIDEQRLSFRLNLVPAAAPEEASFAAWWARELPAPPDRFQKAQYDARSTAVTLTAEYRGVCTVTYADTFLQQRLLGLAQAYVASIAMAE